MSDNLFAGLLRQPSAPPPPSVPREPRRKPQPRKRAEANPWGLSHRQCQIMRLLVAGQTQTAIARSMGISPKTVSTQLERLRIKMDVESTAHAAVMWDRHYREKAGA